MLDEDGKSIELLNRRPPEEDITPEIKDVFIEKFKYFYSHLSHFTKCCSLYFKMGKTF